MKTDKDRVERHKEEATVVFDDTLQGKTIDGINKPVGVDFKDEGYAKIPSSAKNLMVGSHKYASKEFKEGYDEVAWHCAKCDTMHTKSEGCNE